MDHDDFAFEPIRGLPELPPEGEHILWRGAPEWRQLALRSFYVRPVLAYFTVLMIWRIFEAVASGGSLLAGFGYALELAPFAAGAVAILCLLAWSYARSTVYTLTNKRIVFRSGVALPITVNVPFTSIQSADLRVHADGSGDVQIALVPAQNVSSLALWPHIKPWTFRKTMPTLRALADPQSVARSLSAALAASVQGEGAELQGEVSAPARQSAASAADKNRPVKHDGVMVGQLEGAAT